jgi:FkbH-like protein
MDFFVFRNFTVENLFKGVNASYSGYGDISEVPEDAKSYIWFYLPPLKMNQKDLIDEIWDYQNKFQLLFQQIEPSKTIIAFTITSLFKINFENGNFELKKAINNFNSSLIELAKTHANLKILDIEDFQKTANQPLLDWKYYYISQSLISPKLNSIFKNWFLQKLSAIKANRKKCLVLDLDNTLWGGILGEDGIEGIKIGDTYPGLAFKDFQENILEATENGVILAVCSKNNEEDVSEVWEKHPFQVLKEKHFSAYRINWQDKATNIQEIADELNIGLDSFVFIDDNPIERERIKQMLPMVAVPDFPDQPTLMSAFFKDVYETYFQIHALTVEDKNKTQQYVSNAERSVFKKQFASVDDYLSSLEMELDVREANKFTIPRIAQMTIKTNQFNLTTPRYEEADIYSFLQKNALIHCLSVKDKFGDNGITVASIISIQNEEAYIDSFLLSCRILGRYIENAYIDFLINLLFDKKIRTLKAKYIPTKKNRQTENFYEKNGFLLQNILEDGTKNYSIEINQKREIKSYYKFILNEQNDKG